ncbi:MAG: imidazole glycerol phosphate synthase subunit HisH [Rhodospirillaceae bacterium]
MTVAIVDYGSGNLRSAAKAFERAVAETGKKTPILVTSDPDAVIKADRVVLPGVGAFGDCRKGLLAVDGMVEALMEHALMDRKPFLGICVGMQLMAREGFEFGIFDGLDWIPGDVQAISPDDKKLKIPHMGWNTLTLKGSGHPVLKGLDDGHHAYFVHSYQFVPDDPDRILAITDYGGPVTAAVGRDNLIGTQFHPEKSQAVGLRLIKNFLEWKP